MVLSLYPFTVQECLELLSLQLSVKNSFNKNSKKQWKYVISEAFNLWTGLYASDSDIYVFGYRLCMHYVIGMFLLNFSLWYSCFNLG